MYFPFKTFGDKAFTFFAYATGCRIGEVQAVKWSDIDFESKFITIRHNIQYRKGSHIVLGDTKNKKPRIVAASDILLFVLMYWRLMSKHTKPSDYVFLNKRNLPIAGDTIRDAFYDALKRIGITEEERVRRDLSFHSLRHTANSILIEKGVSPEILRRQFGWSDFEIQKIYSQLSRESLRASSTVVDSQFRNQIKQVGEHKELLVSRNETENNAMFEKVPKYDYDILKREKEELELALFLFCIS